MTHEEMTQILAEGAERTRQDLDELRLKTRTEQQESWKRPNGYFMLPAELLDERLVRLEKAVDAMNRKIDDLMAAISGR